MALVLPYPNMDFVPLDILTAAEMNELVANIEYISTQFPVATANIADTSITTGKIADSSITFAKMADAQKSAITIAGTWGDTSYQVAEIALNTTRSSVGSALTRNSNKIVVGAGVSYVLVSANAFMSKTSGYGWVSLYKNSTEFSGSSAIGNLASSGFASATISPVVVPVQQNDTLWLKNLVDATTIRGTQTWITAIAIA